MKRSPGLAPVMSGDPLGSCSMNSMPAYCMDAPNGSQKHLFKLSRRHCAKLTDACSQELDVMIAVAA
uniref:Uncharacterized protein n=1 Tax=Peronospora matthiolae TaxID=2874970 RepID=A0AAV1VK70_9STRA